MDGRRGTGGGGGGGGCRGVTVNDGTSVGSGRGTEMESVVHRECHWKGPEGLGPAGWRGEGGVQRWLRCCSVCGDSASSPGPSCRAGWPSSDLTDHIPSRVSPIARVSSMASFAYSGLFVQASHMIHLGAAINIWNNLPQFPISYTATGGGSRGHRVVRGGWQIKTERGWGTACGEEYSGWLREEASERLR